MKKGYQLLDAELRPEQNHLSVAWVYCSKQPPYVTMPCWKPMTTVSKAIGDPTEGALSLLLLN